MDLNCTKGLSSEKAADEIGMQATHVQLRLVKVIPVIDSDSAVTYTPEGTGASYMREGAAIL